MANEIVKFERSGEVVQFTAEEVRNTLCPQATDKELAFAMALCQAQHLDPFTKDVHLVKYGNGPLSIITSKEVFTKRAQANPKFEGMEAGVTFLTPDGQIVQREGSMPIHGWNLIGGWCKVYVKGYRAPIYDEVATAEYSTGKSNWAKMPGTMIRKVAMCHALREAFPDDFHGLYGEEEMGKAGEVVAEKANGTAEPISEPQSDVSNVVAEADFVEMMSNDQLKAIETTAEQFAELCGKEYKEVIAALMESRSVRESGASVVTEMTADQATVAIGVLASWVEKSRAAHQAVEQLEEDDLVDEDYDF
jgi:phage recombination protein Bet|nr:MAG TPA: RecT protein [Caudoviricetes sp.]